jgi:trimeric autotransporter adhesin
LIVDAVAVPTTAGAGLSIVLNDTTRNLGYSTAAESSTGFYLSANAAFDAGDVFLGSRGVPPLAAGASSSGAVTLTIPADTVTGLYYVVVRADADKAISEAVETNNTAYGSVRIGPDLTVSALTPPVRGGAGTTVLVANTVKNTGGGPAGATSVRFYLSSNSTIDSGDILLGSRSVAALEPGVADTHTTALVVPATTPAASYFLIAKADADGALVETQETNNTRVATLRVDPAP